MHQLQPTTERSNEIFAMGRSKEQVELFHAMLKLAIAQIIENESLKEAEMKTKIAFLYTMQQSEQTPHRDYSKQTFKGPRCPTFEPWGLVMPLSNAGLSLNVWHKEQIEKVGKQKIIVNKKENDNNDQFREHRIPYTLDIKHRHILLFAGSTIHGGGFRSDGNTNTSNLDAKQMNRRVGSFRMHMYLSFATRGKSHGALEGENKVELEDDSGVRYHTYLFKSDGSSF
jgi:hypothetical protein